jgi:long-chain acyl-CoA synthetase
MNVGLVLSQKANDYPEYKALALRDRRLTFAELNDFANRIAHALERRGIAQGDAIALIFPNSIELALLYYGIMKRGAIAAFLDPRLGMPEARSIIERTEAKLIFADPRLRHHENLGELAPLVWTTPEWEKEFLGDASDEEVIANIEETDTALYLHTSGTTGMPKIVALSYRNLDCFPKAMGSVYHTDAHTIMGMVLPMSHISGPIMLNELVDKGSSMVIIDDLNPDFLLKTIEKEKINYFHAVPPIFQAISKSQTEKYDLSSLKFIAMMGTSVPISVMQAFKAKVPHTAILQGYGLTETSPLITTLAPEDEFRAFGSIGKAVPEANVQVVDDEGHALPPHEAGEIIVRGPMVMQGYLKDPEATAKKIRDGWFHTGDIGQYDEERFFYHLGRKDDLIVTEKGLKFYPAEVENVLLSLPEILEAAVVQVKDGKQAIIKAFVVMAPEKEISEHALRTHCQNRLAAFKIPKVFVVRESLPKTGSNKIQKSALR